MTRNEIEIDHTNPQETYALGKSHGYEEAVKDIAADLEIFARFLLEKQRPPEEAETITIMKERFERGAAYGAYEHLRAVRALQAWFSKS